MGRIRDEVYDRLWYGETMSDYPERLRNFNKAGQLQYEWFNEVADHIEELEAELAALERWRAAAFIAHGNLDLDIEADPLALAELKGDK